MLVPENYAETPDGLLFMADGLNPMAMWDGLSTGIDGVGITPPGTALTMSGVGHGPIAGIFYAFSRFVDTYGNVSDLSPLSASYTANGPTGTITAASNASPIVITSASHGLTTGDAVAVAGVLGNIEANGVWLITVIDANTFSLNSSAGGGDYTSGGTWQAGVASISYTNVPVSTETKVVRRQVLRNTSGQAAVFYVDVDTADLTSTSFSSANTDALLAAQIAVPLLDPSGRIFANKNGVPPAHKAVVAHHLGRMFAAVERDYTQGSIQVTNGNTVVVGVNTNWGNSLAGRVLYVNGGTKSYQIASVQPAAQTLVLSAAYSDNTDLFAAYAIRPPRAERRLIYYSESGLPQSWPVVNAIALQEDGDELTGLMVKSSFLYLLEKRHIYRFTFQSDPATDGFTFLSAVRGCVNQRSWTLVDDTAYMLDQAGVHAFKGTEESEPISYPVQRFFTPGDPLHINWSASEFFHCAHSLAEEIIRWFVCVSGEYLPRHALCYEYRLDRWWVEEYQRPISSSATGTWLGQRRVYFGTSAKTSFLSSEGTLDGVDPNSGTTSGTVTGASLFRLTDSAATWPPAGVQGNPVSITAGRGKGQTRIVQAISGQDLILRDPWLIIPDTTSTYQVGSIPWQFQTGWFRWLDDEEEQQRRVEVLFQPLDTAAVMDVSLCKDFSMTPITLRLTQNSRASEGMQSADGSPYLTIDLTRKNGFSQQRLPGKRELNLDGWRFVSVVLSGFSGAEQQTVFQLTLDGAMPKGGRR